MPYITCRVQDAQSFSVTILTKRLVFIFVNHTFQMLGMYLDKVVFLKYFTCKDNYIWHFSYLRDQDSLWLKGKM